MKKRLFASDNFAGVHPKILQAIVEANDGHVKAYGDDPYSEQAAVQFKEHFGPDLDFFFVTTGTAANILSIKTLCNSYEAVICPKTAHIETTECGAIENFVGCKLITIATPDGKLTPELVKPCLEVRGNPHVSQPKVISISQATESGGVYTVEEIRALADFAHQRDLFLHMDGARLSNAAAALGVTLREMTSDAGVDALSFGGTKNGLLTAEAVLLFGKGRTPNYKYIQKQGLQVLSKMRFLAAQFCALLSNDLYLHIASHANHMARRLAERIQEETKEVTIVEPVVTNAVFARLPTRMLLDVQKESFFWIWDVKENMARWMTSWDTTEQDIEDFIILLKKCR